MSRFKFITIMFLYLNATSILAQDGSAGLAGEFLRWGIGARALGMGHAYMALVTDATAGYWNPAGLVEIPVYGFFDPLPKRLWSSFKFATSHHQLLEEITFCNINVSTSLCRYGTLGFGYLRLGTDDIQGWAWDSQGFPMRTNEYLFYHEAKLVSWGGRLLFWPTLDIGVTAKCLHNKVSDYGKRFQGGGMDLGLRLGLNLPEILGIDFYKLDLGLKWQNFIEWNRHFDVGNELYFSSLMGGLAWLPKKIWLLNFSSKFRPRFAFDFEYMESRKEDRWQWRNGLELDWQVVENIRFLLRTGLQSDKLCCGFGINWDGFALDISHKTYKDIGFANNGQVSFSYQENKKSTTNFLNLRKLIDSKKVSYHKKKWFWHKVIDEATDPVLITGAYMELAELENSKSKNNSAYKYYQKFQQKLLFDSIPLKELGFVRRFSFERLDSLLMIFIHHIKCDSQKVQTVIEGYQNILKKLVSQNKDDKTHELREAYFGVVADSFGVKRQDEPEKWLRKLAFHNSIPDSFKSLFKFYLGRHYNKISELDSALKYFDQIIEAKPMKAKLHDSLNIFKNKHDIVFYYKNNPADDALEEWISCLEQNPEKRKQVVNEFARKLLLEPDSLKWITIPKKLAQLITDSSDKVEIKPVQLEAESSEPIGKGYPSDIAINAGLKKDSIYVSEPESSCVRVIDIRERFLKSDPIRGWKSPVSLSVYEKNIYSGCSDGIYGYSLLSKNISPLLESHKSIITNIYHDGQEWYFFNPDLVKLYHGTSINDDNLKPIDLNSNKISKFLERPRNFMIFKNTSKENYRLVLDDYTTQTIYLYKIDDFKTAVDFFYRGPQWWPIDFKGNGDSLFVLYWNLCTTENQIVRFKVTDLELKPESLYTFALPLPCIAFVKNSSTVDEFFIVEYSKKWRIHKLSKEKQNSNGK